MLVVSDRVIKGEKFIFLNVEVGWVLRRYLSFLKEEVTMKNRAFDYSALGQLNVQLLLFFSKSYIKRWECKKVRILPKSCIYERKTGRDMHIALLCDYWAITEHKDVIEQLHNINRQQCH